MDFPHSLNPPDSPELAQAAAAFERAWGGGDPPRLEGVLSRLPVALHDQAFESLLRIELKALRRRGQMVWAEDYLRRFPSQQATILRVLAQAPAEVAEDEAQLATWIAPGQVAKSRPERSTGPAAGALNPLQVGDRLGVYDLVERIGGGGMGEVFRARHRMLDKTFAIKVLAPTVASRPRAMIRFLREIQISGRLDHPHVVLATDAGTSDGVQYLVMEFVEGIDLQRLISRRGPLPVVAACEFVRQAASALAQAHRQGLIHRDVKPANLMLCANGTIKILDFGIARLVDSVDEPNAECLTQVGQLIGTPDFVAPEQARGGGQVDGRADLYSLGCTLFALLAGRGPFQDPEHRGVGPKLRAHLDESIPAITDLRPEVPPPIAQLVAEMTAKRPEDRPATLDEVVERLDHWLAQRDPGQLSDEIRTLTRGLPGGDRDSQGATPARGSTLRDASDEDQSAASGLPTWMLWAGGLAMLALLIGGVTLAPMVGDASWPSPTAQAPPLTIDEFQVEHYGFSADGLHHEARGLIGVHSHAVFEGESVRLRVELSQPAYIYLVAFHPNGSFDLCWPDSREHAPDQVDKIFEFPDLGDAWQLTDGTGQHAFVLLASRQPLPSFDDWLQHQPPLPWRASTGEAQVWVFNGQHLRDAKIRADSKPLDLGHAVPDLCRWLQTTTHLDDVRLLGFPVVAPRP